ncbi:MAG TPA: GTPase-associated system all-helical protein GASH [Archangium sp.]|uniref:GTPase-associated system all-helical protein GASH n=1 Tax=Archangium sp. TaxID=1872627 RepID=UPI002E320DC1|nr:GTPase-associated system all-helical protein GASH [Archangium sp.]HEX5751286.1 GTPase-associated system all-helical protein GASH [Archangium sp.]
MATDTENLLAERFREIRQEWDLRTGEADTTAQNQALAPLHAWLRTGVDAPEVVIRAVQVLMADPERPGIHRRKAINFVFRQISRFWQSAGLGAQDVLILKGMLLACWTDNLVGGHFALTPLLESAWSAIEGRLSREKYLEQWRHQQASPPTATSLNGPEDTASATQQQEWALLPIAVPDSAQTITRIQESDEDRTDTLAKHSASLFNVHQETLTRIANHLNEVSHILGGLDVRVSAISDFTGETLNKIISSRTAQADLLWWGQARYSSTRRQPYRRISDASERLWWMAWESSKLAMGLEVEPAASFLIENLYQLGNQTVDQKRPLKEWLSDLIGTLRRVRENEQHAAATSMSVPLEKLATEDPLGLPVTWARIQAAQPRHDPSAIEERLRDKVAVDPDTLIDLGDWAAWIFRESLLDRHLGAR